jgi:DNA-binding PadR family transcriptional regulator
VVAHLDDAVRGAGSAWQSGTGENFWPLWTINFGVVLAKQARSWQLCHVATNLNSTAAALLGLLHEGSMTGGDLVSAAKDRFGSFWSVTRSQVYRELPGLATAGYVRPGKLGPRAAQPYAITAAGKRAFKTWLAEPSGSDHARNPLILRLGFGAHHAPDQLRQLVTEARDAHTEALSSYRVRSAELKKSNADPFLLATTEFAIAYERALLRWLESVPTSG